MGDRNETAKRERERESEADREQQRDPTIQRPFPLL